MCQKSKSGTWAANRDSNCISIKQVRENVVLVDKRSKNILAEQKYRRAVDCTHIKLDNCLLNNYTTYSGTINLLNRDIKSYSPTKE